MVFPAPLIRIDHVWHDESWRARRAWTGVHAESDHLYLIADLEFAAK
jgi:endonuclease/exonuclease/phosphatase (EEP) superfamily protein YafD